MTLTEKIALDCGAKISIPFLDTFFYPLNGKKYIIFDTRSRFQMGEYDYFNEVLSLIRPYLNENKIEVFQFANDKSLKLDCNRCFIKINKKQENFLIKNSEMVVANENSSVYIAASFNVKCVALYSVTKPQCHAPPWNKNSQIILESHRDGNLPTYGTLNENPKTINFISPYEIAKKILDNLSIKNDLDKFNLVHIGKTYNTKIIEVVPDFYSDANFLKDQAINLRLDYVASISLQVFNYWISNRKVNLITDKDINIAPIANNKNNIHMISVLLSPNISENFLKNCKSLGLKLKIFCTSENDLKNYRFKFLNWEVEKDFNNHNKLSSLKSISSSSKFQSSKVIFSKGKSFSSKATFFANKPLDNSPENVIMNSLFEEELDFFKIYNER